MAKPRIIVVGAGLAGLAAARRLRAGGADVLVLERGEGPGGRAGHDARDGWWFDSGGHQIGAADTALLSFVAESGLAGALLPLRPLATAQVSEGRVTEIQTGGWLSAARTPGVRPLDALRLVRLERIYRRFGDILDPAAPEAGARLDDRSLGDFTRLYFGASALDAWAAPFLAEACAAEPEAVSRLLFLLLWRQRRHAATGALRAGLGRLAVAAAAPLDLRLGAAVAAVVPLPGRSGRLAVQLAAGTEETRFEADAVVIATPAPVARRIAAPLLAPAEKDQLDAIDYAPAVVLHVALERPLVEISTRLRFRPDAGGALQAASFERGSVEGRAPQDRGAVTLVARPEWSAPRLEAPDESLEKELLAELDRLEPAASGLRVFSQLRRHREAWPRFPVGRFHGLAALRRVQADRRAAGRRLYLAGDYLALPTLDGAVSSGRRAADEALADLDGGSSPGR